MTAAAGGFPPDSKRDGSEVDYRTTGLQDHGTFVAIFLAFASDLAGTAFTGDKQENQKSGTRTTRFPGLPWTLISSKVAAIQLMGRVWTKGAI